MTYSLGKGPALLSHDGDKAGILCRRNVNVPCCRRRRCCSCRRTARREGELGFRRPTAVHRAANLHRVVHPESVLNSNFTRPPHGLDEFRRHRVAEVRELDAHRGAAVVRCLVRF